MYKDKDKQRQADKERQRRYRTKRKGVTSEDILANPVTPNVIPLTLTDAHGCLHRIDYKDRARDRGLLESWAKGEGTEYQRSLGILAMKYSQIHGVGWPGSQEIMDADSVYCRGKAG